MIQAHWFVVEELKLQDFFAQDQTSYMFNSAPELDIFGAHEIVDGFGHSGASFGMVCREMQKFAKSQAQSLTSLED
jgi:hypothetical protein